MNRTRWFIAVVLVLALANGIYHWWFTRGLITIHCEDWPPSKVVHEIERQGGALVKTNLPEDLKIQLNIDKVPVAEALETLATVVEARWRLTYIFAPSLPEAHAALAGFASGQRPEGWKQLFLPVFAPVADEAAVLPDPRDDPWLVKPTDKPEFQAYVSQAAESVNAAFAYPEKWNPAVSKVPSAGPIGKSAPSLATHAGGRVLEVFLLEKRGRDNDGPGGPGGPGGPPDDFGGGRFSFGDRDRDRGPKDRDEGDREKRREAYKRRMQAELDKLPADKRAIAQAEADERTKFYESLKDLTPEQRKEKMEERMNNPTTQDRFDQRMSNQMARMSPNQRVSKANKYIQRKESVRAPSGS